MYSTNIKKWGNSLAIRIPKHVAQKLNIDKDTAVELEVEDGELHVKPKSISEYSLEELLRNVSKENIHNEIDFGEARGKEQW